MKGRHQRRSQRDRRYLPSAATKVFGGLLDHEIIRRPHNLIRASGTDFRIGR